MATVTQATLREYFSRELGFWFSGTNTGTATNTVVDANIERYDTGRLRDKWVLMTSGSNDDLSRRIASVTTSTATLVSAFGAANANGNTFEIVPYDPDVMQDALQIAGRNLWPKPTRRGMRGLYLPLTNETLVVDNLIANWDFETFAASAFTSWTSFGSPSLSANTDQFVHGVQAASISGGATMGLRQNLINVAYGGRRISEMVGKTLNVRGWLFADGASDARLRVTFNGTSYTNGVYHGGGYEWEGPNIHSVQASIPDSPSEMTIEIAKDTTALVVADAVVAWIDPVSEYTMPTAFYPHGPSKVLAQRYVARPMGEYVSVGQRYPQSGLVLRLEGPGRLTIPTTDAGTIEIDDTEAELLVAEAAAVLFRNLAGVEPELRERHIANAREWQAIADLRRESYGKLLPPANKHNGWRVSPEEARIIYLDR